MEKQEKETRGESLQITSLHYQSTLDWCRGGILGIFIGLAVIVPGVSGSAIAIIFKLYEKMLLALGNLFKAFKICALFLLPILLGMILGVVLGFFAVRSLLDLLPFATVALFAGLMLGALPAVTSEIKGEKPTVLRIILLILGIGIPLAISAISIQLSGGTSNSLSGLEWYHYILFLVLGYLVALTQLVPGLSATALLMAFGYFTPLMESVSLTYWGENPMVFVVYLCLIVGFVAGLLTISKFMSYFLNKFRGTTFYLIVGLSIGSWIAMFYNPEILATYQAMSPENNMYLDIGLGVGLFVIGVIVAYIFVRYEARHMVRTN